MPIEGLTDREAEFPQIGTIRKGAPKTENAPGADLKYFRVTLDAAEPEAQAKFTSVYTEKPASIDILMPFPEPERCLVAWKEAYLTGAMLHRCDGKRVYYAIDPKNGELLVKNGLSVKDGRPVECIGAPVTSYRNKAGEEVPVNCSPVGRMRVIVPVLRRLAYLVVLTGSKHDIANLASQLRAIWEISPKHSLVGIPLVLRRADRAISTPGKGGKKVRRVKSLLNIEADPRWVERQLTYLQQFALPPGVESLLLQDPQPILAPDPEDEEGEEEEGEELPSGVEGNWETRGESPENENLPAVPPVRPTGKGKIIGFIQDGPAWAELLAWAVEQQFYPAGDKSAGPRMQNILKRQGMEQFTASDLKAAQTILRNHYGGHSGDAREEPPF